jgi:hypothetical protein
MALFDLFGKKDNQPKDAYFLSADESKTYGNIDYMRTVKTVRRTFVKTVGNPGGGEVISQVSSSKMVKADGSTAKRITPKTINNSFSSTYNYNPAPVTPVASTPVVTETQETIVEQSAPAPAPVGKAKSSMDMFRNMAKEIRK